MRLGPPRVAEGRCASACGQPCEDVTLGLVTRELRIPLAAQLVEFVSWQLAAGLWRRVEDALEDEGGGDL